MNGGHCGREWNMSIKPYRRWSRTLGTSTTLKSHAAKVCCTAPHDRRATHARRRTERGVKNLQLCRLQHSAASLSSTTAQVFSMPTPYPQPHKDAPKAAYTALISAPLALLIYSSASPLRRGSWCPQVFILSSFSCIHSGALASFLTIAVLGRP